MRTHIGLGLFACALLGQENQAGPLQTRTIERISPHINLLDPSDDPLIEYWAEQYGFRRSVTELQGRPTVGPGSFQTEMIAKAPRDECFIDIGVHSPILPPNCPPGSIEKANELYLWGAAIDAADEEGGNGDEVIWLGTGANTPCLANGSLGGFVEPSIDEFIACEYGESLLVQQLPVWPAGLGDLRPSRMLRGVIDGDTGELSLQDLTPGIDFIGDFQRFTTAGIRAVGISGNVVLFAGPALTVSGTINMWAFRRSDGVYLGSKGFLEWGNIRKFLTVDGEMYVGVLNSWDNPHPGGSVLRWTGNEGDPFQFEEVARLDNEVAELAVHEQTTSLGTTKVLVAGTWPRLYGTLDQTDELYGLFMSPPLPLDSTDADDWEQIFRIDQYEPDPVTARAIASGGIASFDGYIWFGTLITVGIPALAWIEAYGIPIGEERINEVILGTYRPLTLFRGRMVDAVGGPTFEVEVLYGNEELPVYQFFPGNFQPQPTGLGPPTEGLGGIDEMFNTYTWAVQVGADGLLYVGTLDNSFSLQGVQIPGQDPVAATGAVGRQNFGADLFAFGPGSTKARVITRRGFGNDTNSGIRNMVAGQTGIYAGTGNVSNIAAEGGWELHRILSPMMLQDN